MLQGFQMLHQIALTISNTSCFVKECCCHSHYTVVSRQQCSTRARTELSEEFQACVLFTHWIPLSHYRPKQRKIIFPNKHSHQWANLSLNCLSKLSSVHWRC